MEKSWPFTVARKILMVVNNVLKYCIILIYAKIHSVFPSGVPFLHTLFLENKAQASGKKNTGQCCSTEMEIACENSAYLEQETKTTKIVTYSLFSLASSYIQ